MVYLITVRYDVILSDMAQTITTGTDFRSSGQEMKISFKRKREKSLNKLKYMIDFPLEPSCQAQMDIADDSIYSVTTRDE